MGERSGTKGGRCGKVTYIEVLGVDFIVLGKVVVFLGDEHALCNKISRALQMRGVIDVSENLGDLLTSEQVLVNLLSISLGDEPTIYTSVWFLSPDIKSFFSIYTRTFWGLSWDTNLPVTP